MPKRLSLFGTLLAAGLVVAACGGTAGSASPGAASPSVAAGASASPAVSPSAAASGSPAASPSAAASPMTVEELEASIPTEVAGTTLTVSAASPADLPFFTGEEGAGRLAGLLLQIGGTAEGMVAATGTAEDGSLRIVSVSVAGVDGQNLLLNLVTFAHATAADVSNSRETVGGKQVVKSIATVEDTTETTYFYAGGSVVYAVTAEDEATAEAALQALP